MKLYHGTPEYNAENIETSGFEASELAGFTPADYDGDVVFFAETIEGALEYGNAVFEIESEGHERFYQVCPISSVAEYWLPLELVNDELIYTRIN